MKISKIISGLALGLTLTLGVAQAQAAILTDWTYNLTSVSFANLNSDFVKGSSSNMSFDSGSWGNSLTTGGSNTGGLGFTGPSTSASSDIHDTLLAHVATAKTTESTSATKLGDLVFSYSVASDANANVRMNITYTIPMYTYYDSANETSYVYYNNSEVSTRGATAITHENYKYGITGVGLFVDGRALESFTGAEGDPNLYSGWAINNDTMVNNYSQYIVGEDNSEFYLGGKTTPGLFNITGVFSIANTQLSPDADPTPTPEPATMLLTGLGLAGLGALKRRRNK